MLATPPGSLIGDISEAAVVALCARFGPGVELRVSPAGAGPFDIYVAPEAPFNREIDRLCGSDRGLIELGLERKEADRLYARLPTGSARLVARDLVRYDLVFNGGIDLPPAAIDWLSEHCGVAEHQLGALDRHAPIALAEALTSEQAERMADTGRAAGVPVTTAPAGFDRCSLRVLRAADPSAVAELSRQLGLSPSEQLPAMLATDLGDLDARCLAHQFELIGAVVSFEESR